MEMVAASSATSRMTGPTLQLSVGSASCFILGTVRLLLLLRAGLVAFFVCSPILVGSFGPE